MDLAFKSQTVIFSPAKSLAEHLHNAHRHHHHHHHHLDVPSNQKPHELLRLKPPADRRTDVFMSESFLTLDPGRMILTAAALPRAEQSADWHVWDKLGSSSGRADGRRQEVQEEQQKKSGMFRLCRLAGSQLFTFRHRLWESEGPLRRQNMLQLNFIIHAWNKQDWHWEKESQPVQCSEDREGFTMTFKVS